MVDYSGARLKVERAKAHIAEVEREVAAFLGRRPYRIVQELNLEIERFAMLVSLTRPLPVMIPVIVGDAVHNLRTALDHALCAIVAAEGKTIRDTTFPFAKLDADFEEVLKRKARKAPAPAKQACRDIKPYPGGNDLLVALHELDLMDKHQLVLTMAAAGTFNAQYIERDGKPEHRIAHRVHYLGAETEVIPLPEERSSDVPFEISLTVEVVFGPDTPCAGEPCVLTLCDLTVAVENALMLLHAACP